MDNKNSIEQLYAYVKDCYDGEIRCLFFNDPATTDTSTLPLRDALPV